MSDLYWQDNIRTGSDNLLAAIRVARGEVKAPPVQQELPMQRSIPIPPQPKPEKHTQEQQEAALRLFAEGHLDGTIAQKMKLSSGMAARGILLVVKRRTPSIYWRAYDRHMAARGITR